MKEPGVTDIKTLFALSGNVCAFFDEDGQHPACEQKLTDPSWKRVMANICHIYGENQGSARWDPAHDHDGHEFWNLILLCPNHHTVIDGTEADRFPPEKLIRMKERALTANAPAQGGPAWADEAAIERYVVAALATYRRERSGAAVGPGEDPSSGVDELTQLRQELGYHSAWRNQLDQQLRDEGLSADESTQFDHHQHEMVRLQQRIAELGG